VNKEERIQKRKKEILNNFKRFKDLPEANVIRSHIYMLRDKIVNERNSTNFDERRYDCIQLEEYEKLYNACLIGGIYDTPIRENFPVDPNKSLLDNVYGNIFKYYIEKK